MSLYMTADECKATVLKYVDWFRCPVCGHKEILPVPRPFVPSTLMVACPHGHGRLKFSFDWRGWEWSEVVDLRGEFRCSQD
jgi:rRNA maturation protein Nop10